MKQRVKVDENVKRWEKLIFEQTWTELTGTLSNLAPYPKKCFRFVDFDIYNGIIESTWVENGEFHAFVYGLDQTRDTHCELIEVIVSYERAAAIFASLSSYWHEIEMIIKIYEEQRITGK